MIQDTIFTRKKIVSNLLTQKSLRQIADDANLEKTMAREMNVSQVDITSHLAGRDLEINISIGNDCYPPWSVEQLQPRNLFTGVLLAPTDDYRVLDAYLA